MAITLAFVHALSSLHAGTGQGVGVIDLPIARERATNLPFLPGSSIKGCLRDVYTGEHADVIFGSDDPKNAFAGALHISDARLLLLPVRSLETTFVWTTCPYILRRLTRDAQTAGLAGIPATPQLSKAQACVASPQLLSALGAGRRLILEDLDLDQAGTGAAEWATWIGARLFAGQSDWQRELSAHFAIVDDDSFAFLAEFATEVNAHIRIGESGTVEPGALWYQESLPAETVLVSLLQAERSWKKDTVLSGEQVFDKIKGGRFLQLGGKATTGQGAAMFLPVGAGGVA